jgi:hypothetical protein
MKSSLLAFYLFISSFSIFAQVGIGTVNPDPSSALDVFANDKGLLLPRVALTGTLNFTPLLSHVAGMLVYNTVSVADVIPGQYYNDGTKWILVGSSAGTKNYTFLRSVDDLPAETNGDESTSAYRIGQTTFGNVDKTANVFYGSSPISVATPSPAKVSLTVVNQFTEPTVDGVKVAGQFVNLVNPVAGSIGNDARAIVARTFSSPTSNANYVGLYGGSISATHVGIGTVDTAFGLLSNVRNSATSGFSSRIVNANGADLAVRNDPSAVIEVVKGVSQTTTNDGTITTNHGLYIDRTGGIPFLGLGNYTTNYGIRVRDTSLGTTVTGYGLFLEDVKATTGFGIYQAGSNDRNNFNGNVGIKTLLAPKAELEVAGTGAIIVPIGTTAQRPATPVVGMIRFNSSLGKFEGYNGSAWNILD